MESAHPLRRRLQGSAARSLQRIERGVAFFPADFQRRERSRAQAVELVGVFQHRRIAARLDVGQNASNGALDRFVFTGLECQHRVKLRFEVRIGRVQPAYFYRHDDFKNRK